MNDNLNNNIDNTVNNTNNMTNNLQNMQPNPGMVQQPVQPNPGMVQQPKQSNVDEKLNAVDNLKKEEAMEEALSHTNQYPPFEVPKQEINTEVKHKSKKSAYITLIIIFIILALFIFFLPKIASLFGWQS